jgi:hypothetical protein
MQHLTMQIGDIDGIMIDYAYCSFLSAFQLYLSSQLDEPTPAPARYWSNGHPSPPAPTTATLAALTFI